MNVTKCITQASWQSVEHEYGEFKYYLLAGFIYASCKSAIYSRTQLSLINLVQCMEERIISFFPTKEQESTFSCDSDLTM